MLWIAAAPVPLPNSLQCFQPTSSRVLKRTRSSPPRFKAPLIGTWISLYPTFSWIGYLKRAVQVTPSSQIPSLGSEMWEASGPWGSLSLDIYFLLNLKYVIFLSCTRWYRCLHYYYQSWFVWTEEWWEVEVMSHRATHTSIRACDTSAARGA